MGRKSFYEDRVGSYIAQREKGQARTTSIENFQESCEIRLEADIRDIENSPKEEWLSKIVKTIFRLADNYHHLSDLEQETREPYVLQFCREAADFLDNYDSHDLYRRYTACRNREWQLNRNQYDFNRLNIAPMVLNATPIGSYPKLGSLDGWFEYPM